MRSCVMCYLMLVRNHSYATDVSAGLQAVQKNEAEFIEASKNLVFSRQAVDDAIVKYADEYVKA